jgi:hypothetical protein
VNRRSRRHISISGNHAFCHICGLNIPDGIASPTHSLFGTVDHAVPLSKGGRNELSNRSPSHRLCNQSKGNRVLTRKEREDLQGRIKSLLSHVGVTVTHKMLTRANKRLDRAACVFDNQQKGSAAIVRSPTVPPSDIRALGALE